MNTTRRDNPRDETGPDPAQGGVIAPEDSFLVQIRGGSRPADHAIAGRIEHLHSGESEQFGSLGELLEFLARHFGLAATTTWSDREEIR